MECMYSSAECELPKHANLQKETYCYMNQEEKKMSLLLHQ